MSEQNQAVLEVVEEEQEGQEEQQEKSWLDVYESLTEWRAIRGDSFVVNKEQAAGTFELVCRASGNVLYCEVAGKLVEVYRDVPAVWGQPCHGSLEAAITAGKAVWGQRDAHLRAALKSTKTTRQGKREKVSLAEKAALGGDESEA